MEGMSQPKSTFLQNGMDVSGKINIIVSAKLIVFAKLIEFQIESNRNPFSPLQNGLNVPAKIRIVAKRSECLS